MRSSSSGYTSAWSPAKFKSSAAAVGSSSCKFQAALIQPAVCKSRLNSLLIFHVLLPLSWTLIHFLSAPSHLPSPPGIPSGIIATFMPKSALPACWLFCMSHERMHVVQSGEIGAPAYSSSSLGPCTCLPLVSLRDLQRIVGNAADEADSQ